MSCLSFDAYKEEESTSYKAFFGRKAAASQDF
jgi:hypothetical protein